MKSGTLITAPVSRVAGFVANYFGITGGAQQLKGVEDSYGVYGATHAGTHKGVATDVKLVLKIFTKDAVVEEPDDDGANDAQNREGYSQTKKNVRYYSSRRK